FKAEIDSLGGKPFCDQEDAVEQFLKGWIAFFVRKETGVERDQLQPQLPGDDGARLDIPPVFIPGPVERDAASSANRFQRRIIFADSPEHAGDQRDVVSAKNLQDFTPNTGPFADRIERDLNAADTDSLELCNEIVRISRLDRPTANRESLSNGRCHSVLSSLSSFAVSDASHFAATVARP